MIRYFLIILTVLFFNNPLFADFKEIEKIMSSENAAQGYEFLIAIPPNEIASWQYGDIVFFVSSTQPTTVELQNPITNALISRKVINKNFGVVTFGNRAPYGNELNMARDEVRLPETPQNKVFRIISTTNPISVYVLNSKNTTSDGFMAIPTASWGTDYIHCGYYDKNEGTALDQGMLKFGSGFLVIASENQTMINIDIKGRGSEFAGTTSGKKRGDKINVTLNRGQVYLVRGDASTVGTFDLTGTRVTSNKPIGLISYHQRTDIPSLIGSSRDHLCEMIPPVQAWGKSYAAVELSRKKRGDLFRIVAAENMTNYEVVWYDMDTGAAIDYRNGTLLRSGDFVDIIEHMQAPGPGINSVEGVSVFTANKPILLMKYSYSAGWDGDNRYDPFMVLVPPVEQFTKISLFQTPGKEFSNNWVNLIAIGDPDDNQNHTNLIESIELDGKPVQQLDTRFRNNRIPGTNLYWARMKVSVGPHYIRGDTPFGGYIYGFTSVDSYGWPIGKGIEPPIQIDTLPPVLNINEIGTGNYEVSFTEIRNGNPGDDPIQVETGVNTLPILTNASNNFKSPYHIGNFDPNSSNFEGTFRFDVIDTTKDAKAVFSIADIAGNVVIDSIMFTGIVVQRVILLDPTNKATSVPRKPNFKWEDIGTEYMFYIGMDENNLSSYNYFNVDSSDITLPYLLLPGVEYFWRVQPISSTVLSSDIWSFKTTEEIGDVILIEPSFGETDVSLNPTFKWSDMQVSNYNFEISKSNDFNLSFNTLVYSNSAKLEFPLEENTKYYWRIKANEGIYSSTSQIGEFSTIKTSSVNDNELNKVLIYPNPANDKLVISVQDAELFESATIVNSLGIIVKTVSKSELKRSNVVEIKEFSNGSYFVNITYNKKVVTIPITINR